jgi:hypothetical protein
MDLEECVKSTKNINLLHRFAFKILTHQYPNYNEELRQSIEFILEQFLDTFEVPKWALNSETLGDVNVSIWRKVRPLIEKNMDSRPIEEVKLFQRHFVQENRENSYSERHSVN